MNSHLPRSVALRVLALTLVISLLMGCSTMRYGGAPEPSFNLKNDIEELKEFGLTTSIKTYYQNTSHTDQDRNYFIIGRLTLINLRYLEFVRNLTCDRQLLDSAVGMALLGLNLAGTAVPFAQTKTILAGISAGIAGSKDVIDKNYYFEKTIPALIAQMNAERQKALTPLLQGMKLSVKDYPFENGVVDLDNYYNAGTFTGAIQSIQADAGKKEQVHKDANAKYLPDVTRPQIDKKKVMSNAIISFQNTPQNLIKIKMATISLAALKGNYNVTLKDDFDGAKSQLQDYIREMELIDLDKYYEIIKNIGIISE